ncbi:coiled-coil domain-containing protein 178 isoform X2 [Castor canadensis]|uniref:Coiled-coil domain-containing protein 178 isoform X2 n=1 Tax=Castor canadensis TaxID=51338 RepID=A0AC58M9S6_CASCN
MPENETIISSSPAGNEPTEIGKTCQEIKALREQARKAALAGNVISQRLGLFSGPKEAVEIFHESKMTNTEEVNKGIYFSYPCRRHSCAVVNIPAPCVNKMISHIDEVESKIQEHLKQFETSLEEWTRTSSTKDLKEDWAVATPVIPEERDEKCPELKQEMETLLSEAIHLIKSLETDRAEAELALKQQKSRRKRISMKIDSWSIWKLQELPLAVQREHEAYAKDIIELRWHIEDRTHQLEQLEKQKTKLKEANAKIQEDIDYMREHSTFLEAKQKQEKETLKEQYNKKHEVMELLRRVHEELEEAKKECENAKLKLSQIEEEIKQSISRDEASLMTYKKELDKLNGLFSYYNTSIQNANVKIEKNEETVSEVMKETKSSTHELSALVKQLDDLKKLFEQLSWKQKYYKNQYLQTLNDFYAAKKTWDIELSNVEKDYSDISIAHNKLLEENRWLKSEMDSIVEKTNESIKKKQEYEMEIQSLLKLKQKNAICLKELYKEAYRIGAFFVGTKYKTDELEEKIAETRRKFKGREEFLKKLTRGEVAAGIVIQALRDILKRKNQVQKSVEKTKKKLRSRGKKTRVVLTETADKHSTVYKELEITKSKTITFNTKIQELKKELKEMEEQKINFDKKLEILNNEFLDVRFKKEHLQAVFDHLMEEKRNCEDRITEEALKFRRLIATRQQTLANIQVSIIFDCFKMKQI